MAHTKHDKLKSSTKISKNAAKEATRSFSVKGIKDPTSLKARFAEIGKDADKRSNKEFNKRLKKKLSTAKPNKKTTPAKKKKTTKKK